MWPYADTISIIVPRGHEIHGVCRLPHGYTLAFVPQHAEVRNIPAAKPDDDNTNDELKEHFDNTISASFSTIKSAVAVLQTLYASFTLYRTRGDQLNQFGYAAFGLTVAPFLVMSIINLIGNMVTPEYATIYMVRSDIMAEAIGRGAVIDGEVGEIVPAEHSAWTTGVPNDLSGTVMSIDQDNIEMTDITYSTPSTTALQQQVPEPTNKLTKNDARDKVTSLAPPQGDGDTKKEIREIDAEDELATDTSTLVKLKWMTDIQQNQQERIPALLFPTCNNFATTHPPVINFPRDITDVGQLPWLQRFYFKHSVLALMIMLWAVNLTISGISIAIIGGISSFDKGNSTTAQRVWTMLWLSFGFFIGPTAAFVPSPSFLVYIFKDQNRETRDPDGWRYAHLGTFISYLIYGVPAVGGYVVVGKMLYEYGKCIDIS